jgi:hypothetical protein
LLKIEPPELIRLARAIRRRVCTFGYRYVTSGPGVAADTVASDDARPVQRRRQNLRPVVGESLGRGRWGAPRSRRSSVLGLVCLVVADGAACRSTENTMMTGKMPCGTAHQGALDAPFGLGRCRYGDKRDRNRGASKSLGHLLLPGTKKIEVVIKQRDCRKSSNQTPDTAGSNRVPGGRGTSAVRYALAVRRRIPAD